MRIVALSGSVAAGSSNVALLRAAAALAPAGTTVDVYDAIGALPMFNPDLDGEGAVAPPAVGDLRTRLRAADGILIATPEYAHGVPGALKNALDWIVSSGELEGKPLALIVASPGGGAAARASLTPTLEVMGARIVASAGVVFTRKYVAPDGTVTDAAVAHEITTALAALARAAAAPA